MTEQEFKTTYPDIADIYQAYLDERAKEYLDRQDNGRFYDMLVGIYNTGRGDTEKALKAKIAELENALMTRNINAYHTNNFSAEGLAKRLGELGYSGTLVKTETLTIG